MHNGFYLRLLTVASKFSIPKTATQCLRRSLAASGLSLTGIWRRQDKIEPLSAAKLEKCFPLKKQAAVSLVAGTNHDVELLLIWMPDSVLGLPYLSPRSRLGIGIHLPTQHSWTFSEQLFWTFVEEFSPHWGELNDIAIVGKPSLCDINSHYDNVPHLGTANYFGSEYVSYFGGIDQFIAAGFGSTIGLHKGVYVRLPSVQTTEQYEAERTTIEGRLHHSLVFGPTAKAKLPRWNYD